MQNKSMDYCTKADLYQYVDKFRAYAGITSSESGINLVDFCQRRLKVKLEIVALKERTLRGVSIPKDKIIILNGQRSPEERNFDCGHELIHVLKHKKETFQTFCFDKLRPQQNSYLEWQANEGSAELLVSHKVFIPMFCEKVANCKSQQDYYFLKQHLAERFNVPYTVIEWRIDNLRYEIQQYEQGRGINELEILSNTQLSRRGISVMSYNVVFDFFCCEEAT